MALPLFEFNQANGNTEAGHWVQLKDGIIYGPEAGPLAPAMSPPGLDRLGVRVGSWTGVRCWRDGAVRLSLSVQLTAPCLHLFSGAAAPLTAWLVDSSLLLPSDL